MYEVSLFRRLLFQICGPLDEDLSLIVFAAFLLLSVKHHDQIKILLKYTVRDGGSSLSVRFMIS